jgi:hypothetical protein
MRVLIGKHACAFEFRLTGALLFGRIDQGLRLDRDCDK